MVAEKRKLGWLWQKNQRTQKIVHTVTVAVQATGDLDDGHGHDEECRQYIRSCPGTVIILDVGGEKFTALKSTLFRLPTSRYIILTYLVNVKYYHACARLGKLVRAVTVRLYLSPRFWTFLNKIMAIERF